MKNYIERFRRKVNNVKNLSNESILIAISAGLWKDRKLYENIYKSLMRDLGEFYKRAANEVRWEGAFGLKKPTDQKKGAECANQNRKRGNGDSHKGDQGRSTND